MSPWYPQPRRRSRLDPLRRTHVRPGLESLETRLTPALSITNNTSGLELVQAILGDNVTVSNVSFIGHTGTSTDKFGDSSSAGTFTGGADVIGFDSGIILSSGGVQSVVGPNEESGTTQVNDLSGDADLETLTNLPTFDATVLEFDFIPTADRITFQYVFASEEYNEFANSPFNDVFGFFLNGQNVALLPGTTTPVAINTVNGGNPFGFAEATEAQNPEFFINNRVLSEDGFSDTGGSINTELDGLTVVLNVAADVNPGQINHIKLAISDTSDSVLDSAVFIRGGSFASNRPPSVTVAAPSVVVGAGPTTINTGTFSDPDAGQQVTVTASLGTITQTGINTGTFTLSLGPDDSFVSGQTVTVTATDTSGAFATTSFVLVLTDDPTLLGPELPEQGPDTSDPGNFTDPGSVFDPAVMPAPSPASTISQADVSLALTRFGGSLSPLDGDLAERDGARVSTAETVQEVAEGTGSSEQSITAAAFGGDDFAVAFNDDSPATGAGEVQTTVQARNVPLLDGTPFTGNKQVAVTGGAQDRSSLRQQSEGKALRIGSSLTDADDSVALVQALTGPEEIIAAQTPGPIAQSLEQQPEIMPASFEAGLFVSAPGEESQSPLTEGSDQGPPVWHWMEGAAGLAALTVLGWHWWHGRRSEEGEARTERVM